MCENLCRDDGIKNSCYIICFSFFRWSFCVVCTLVYNILACVAGAKRGGGGRKGKEPLLLILALVLKQFLYY